MSGISGSFEHWTTNQSIHSSVYSSPQTAVCFSQEGNMTMTNMWSSDDIKDMFFEKKKILLIANIVRLKTFPRLNNLILLPTQNSGSECLLIIACLKQTFLLLTQSFFTNTN